MDPQETKPVMEYLPHYVNNTKIYGDYDSVEELIEEIHTIEKHLLDTYSKKWTDLGCKVRVSVEIRIDADDSGVIDLELRRSDTTEEKKVKEDKIVEAENKKKLKETQLMLAEDDPEYHQFVKLKEKFKHLS